MSGRDNRPTRDRASYHRRGSEIVATQSNVARRQQALALHQKGILDEAEGIYDDLLRELPHDAQLFHLKGVLRQQRGDHAVQGLEAMLDHRHLGQQQCDDELQRDALADGAPHHVLAALTQAFAENFLARAAPAVGIRGIDVRDAQIERAVKHLARGLKIAAITAKVIAAQAHQRYAQPGVA